MPLAPNKIDRYISRGQSPYHLFPSSSRSSENANRSHRIKLRFSDDLYSF
ncbi:hypothetical protein NEISICOT_01582 [Neisseria sicca ATCC 29256]|uniref:Uncharacterized protein n=1 Tax=Neisseria sicca ATCC 29256 TaxID=547045 RepID=C6M4Y2_NEISI|nr:hypothetical protein NEISICOT_01582 [Neisseria sicca ATCC 29256]